jgi:hypothetical protein
MIPMAKINSMISLNSAAKNSNPFGKKELELS